MLLALAQPPAAALTARVTVWFDLNGNGTREAGEPGAPGVTVSDGDRLQTTGGDGTTTLHIVAENGHGRRVFVVLPGGHRPTTPWHRYLEPETVTEQPLEFGLAPLAEPTPLRFAVTAEPQVTIADARTVGSALGEELTGDPATAFGVVLGDLTEHGTPAELQAFAEVLAGRPVYCLFGANDGRSSNPRDTAAFEQHVGPPWYAFWRGGHLFVALVTEPGELTGLEQARQLRWLRRLVVAQAEETPAFLLCHVPPADQDLALLRQRLAVRAVCYAHWHENAVWQRDGIAMWCTGPYRGSEFGAGTGSLRRVTVTADGLSAEVVRTGLGRLGAVLSPTLLQPPTGERVPLHLVTDDSTVPIASVAALREGQAAMPLARLGRCNWRLEAPLQTGEALRLQITASDGTSTEQRLTVPPVSRALTIAPAAGPPAPPLRRAWLTNLGGARRDACTPQMAGGRLYVPCPDDDHPARPAIVAVDAVSGQVAWRAPTMGSVRRDLVVSGGRVFALTHLAVAQAFDADDGRPLWSRELAPDTTARHRGGRTGLAAAGGLILAQTPGGPLLALDPASGETVAKAAVGGAHLSVPCATATQAVVPALVGVASFDLAALAPRWRLTRDEPFERHSTVTIANGLAYFLGPDLYAVDAVSGDVRWSKPLAVRGLALGAPLVADGVVYTPGPRPTAFHAVTGAPHWDVAPLAAYAGTSPAVAGEFLWTVDDEGALIAYRLTDGAEAWRAAIGLPLKSTPVVWGNAVYVLDGYGNMHAFVPEPPT